MRLFTAAALAAFAFACSSEGSGSLAPPLFSSGTRLRATVIDGGGGAVHKIFGWFDVLHELHCSFTPARDGRIRCLPEDHTVYQFADAACTQPAESEHPCRPAHEFVRSLTYTLQCGAGAAFVDVHQIGEARMLDRVFTRTGPEGQCVEVRLTTPELRRIYSASVDASLFVGADELVEPRGSISVRVWQGEDGSREEFGYYDPVRDVPCMFPYGGQVDNLCLSGEVAYAIGSSLLAEDCSTPVARGYVTSECAKPTVVFRTTSGHPPACGQNIEYFEVGRELASSEVRTMSCGTDVDEYPAYYEIGPRVQPGAYPKMKYGDFGDQRLKLHTASTLEGQRLPALYSNWFDSAAGAFCATPPRGAPGTPDQPAILPCTPAMIWQYDRYYAADCQTQLARFDSLLPRAECSEVTRVPEWVHITISNPPDACPPEQTEARLIGAVHSGDVFIRSEGRCVRLDYDTPPEGLSRVYFEVSEPVALESLGPPLKYYRE